MSSKLLQIGTYCYRIHLFYGINIETIYKIQDHNRLRAFSGTEEDGKFSETLYVFLLFNQNI